MPKIETLVEDIYDVFNKEIEVTPEDAKRFGETLTETVIEKLKPQQRSYLRLSNVGESCLRKLWYSVNTPELGEKLSGPTRIKFLIGDIIEHVILFLARLSGHTVENEQKEVTLHGVRGHIDADIDGELVDVKSASTPNFRKFENGLTPETDNFGYIPQLSGYGAALDRKSGSFLAVDKVSGSLHLDQHQFTESDFEGRIHHIREVLAQNEPPERGYEDQKDGESGNRSIPLKCSYCAFKFTCWPGLQVRYMAKGPVFYTKLVREPQPRKNYDPR